MKANSFNQDLNDSHQPLTTKRLKPYIASFGIEHHHSYTIKAI